MTVGRLDPVAGVVRDPAGRATELKPRAAQLLRVLAEAKGAVVAKNTLLDRVWSDTTVSEDSLYQAVAEVRRGLGPDGASILKTKARSGYRLRDPGAGAEAAARTGSLPRALAALAVVVLLAVSALFFTGRSGASDLRTPTIAVLPFEASGERWSLIGRGLSADIAGALGRSAKIRVTAPGSAQRAAAGANPADVLGVRYVVAGTIQTEGDALRVSVRLTDHSDDTVIWSEVWSGAATEVFGIQDAIIGRIEAALTSMYSSLPNTRDLARAHARPTDSLGAYESFLLAVEAKHRFTADSYDEAMVHLDRALTLDPDYALAWALLSLVESFRSDLSTGEEAEQLMVRSARHARRAYELAPNDPDVIQRMALIGLFEGESRDWAAEKMRRAIDIAPNNADTLAVGAWIAPYAGIFGEEPAEWAARAEALNPFPPDWYAIGLGVGAFAAGDDDRAIRYLAPARGQFEALLFLLLAKTRSGDPSAPDDLAELMELKPDFRLSWFFGDGAADDPAMAELYEVAQAAGLALD